MRFLYSGVVVFVLLAAFTAQSLWRAWHQRTGEARAAAVFDLVQQRTASRPTEAPGAIAWLRLELGDYAQHVPDTERARTFTTLAESRQRVPPQLEGVALALRHAMEQVPAGDEAIEWIAAPANDAGSLRRQRIVRVGNVSLVATRRRELDVDQPAAPSSSNRFIAAVAPLLRAGAADVLQTLAATPLPAVPRDSPPRPVRLYAVAEDGTLVSAPLDMDRGAAAAVDDEVRRLAARPALPAFAPQEFFFTFDFADRTAAGYSGFYLDLGGRGLVSTLTMPLAILGGQHGVLALDLGFDIDWSAFAASVRPPVLGVALSVPRGDGTWSRFMAALPADTPAALRESLASLAGRERGGTTSPVRAPLHHEVVADAGAVAAFQVSDSIWLLALFPNTAPAFPVVPLILLSTLLLGLLAGFEVNRRRADAERRQAERALLEKQSLLNTMQVPLVVVDPNSDVLVSTNRAAQTLGLRAGLRFADFVGPGSDARRHYERMQVASVEPRRAYGVPLRVRDEAGELQDRYALVRSVAVTAPIEALAADQRHRLAVLFLVEPVADLALFTEALEAAAHHDERRRLAGLLSHGVDTLARVLQHSLAHPDRSPDRLAFSAWLAEYVERRLRVTAWLLEHWDVEPPLPPETVIDAEHVRTTVARFAAVFELVGHDADLRSRLHWDNGALSGSSSDGGVIESAIDWPTTFEFTCPVPGGVGLFLGEVLTNAVRHGAPGSVPRLTIDCDRARKELTFQVENATVGRAVEPPGQGYGGLQILTTMARLFGWSDLVFERQERRFVVRWRVAAAERGAPGKAD